MRPFSTPLSLLILILIFAGCDESLLSGTESGVIDDAALMADAATKKGAPEVFSDDTPATVASFDALSGELPEGIALDRFGNIYVSMTGLGEIWKLNPDGSFEETFASFELNSDDQGVLGIRFDPRGNLYAAVVSTNADVHGIWEITSEGSKERLAGTSDIAFPNDVAVSPRGVLYITDSASGAVWRYTPGGEAEIWIQDESLEGTGAFGLGIPIGANGVVVASGSKMPFARGSGPSTGGVLVANSEKGQLVYVPIRPGGNAGEPVVVIADPDELFGLDGITVDARGAIYGAVNIANTIVRVSRDGSEVDEVASGGPLDFPASLAFGTGRERHTLFIANYAIIHFLSDPPTPSEANPSVASVHVGPPGRSPSR